MPLISPIIENIVNNKVPDGFYLRATDEDANIELDWLDIADKTVVLYNNLPLVNHSISAGTFVTRLWSCEIKILRLAEFDDDTVDGDVLRATCLQAADIIYDNLVRSVNVSKSVPLPDYQIDFADQIKLYDKILTGCVLLCEIPIDRDTYNCP